jgi:hypothetical protein
MRPAFGTAGEMRLETDDFSRRKCGFEILGDELDELSAREVVSRHGHTIPVARPPQALQMQRRELIRDRTAWLHRS